MNKHVKHSEFISKAKNHEIFYTFHKIILICFIVFYNHFDYLILGIVVMGLKEMFILIMRSKEFIFLYV